MLLSLIGLYFGVALMVLVFLASKAGDNATTSDLWIGALVWPFTAIKFIQHLATY